MSPDPAEADRAATARALKEELRAVSSSFRKRGKRHFLSTPDVIYCAFSTPRFSVGREEAQRDAARRLFRFGLGEADVRGKRVLDLGSNNGAMLFELSKFAPASALGVEYDGEKVDLARRIAEFAGLTGLEFRQADVDALEASDLGPPFDVVLCLALEAHVQKPKRLYRLLGELTRGKLYFEANASTKPKEVESELRDAGFADIRNLGVCDDDIVPRNNRRPIFTARRD
jgi:2-polyprenyl-3-methyl-5-hydroxy-6-metoxy-1,4-benzoquinol methylase